MRSSDYSSSRSDTHTQDDLIGLIHSHTYLQAHAALIWLIQHPLQTHFSLLAFPFISYSHTCTHTDELYNLSHFLVLPVFCEVRSKPSFAEISFYVSVYTHCKSQSCSIVFTSFPLWRSHFLLHCVSLPWGTFLKLCEICAACVCVHTGMQVLMQETVLHMPTMFEWACQLVCNALKMNCICEIKIQVFEASKMNFKW